MSETGPNSDEARYWASPTGLSWIENEAALDTLFASVTDAVLDAADLKPGESVLDVGCGTGAHALAAARRVGAGGRVTALDISPPLLRRAEARATAEGLADRFEFAVADAQSADLGVARYDLATSRFGVMFFADPAAAFANIAKTVRPGGRMVFGVWGPVARNPWWGLPSRVAGEVLGPLPKTAPNAPGPMGLSDADYVRDVLRGAGLEHAEVEPLTVFLRHPEGAAGAVALSLRVGSAARALRLYESTAVQEAEVAARLEEAYRPFEADGEFRMPAVLNLIRSRLP
ncbi:class I SAM-dependent methyltransferase [Silicimonas algicola]|uniref:Methyltransferase family protein n=1 Tax=Silicimonas algicola TaxID=1826607 RepID=A0A316G2F8_9RHOB|nr:methyltransferase domain-containing protein [Silicimonas algicola]PWK54086.1 methyltransferase family protein [Silicimonas algicola]